MWYSFLWCRKRKRRFLGFVSKLKFYIVYDITTKQYLVCIVHWKIFFFSFWFCLNLSIFLIFYNISKWYENKPEIVLFSELSLKHNHYLFSLIYISRYKWKWRMFTTTHFCYLYMLIIKYRFKLYKMKDELYNI